MMYKCDCCGRLFEEPKIFQEYRGECFGFPSYETMSSSPCCGDDYYEVDCDEYGILNSLDIEEYDEKEDAYYDVRYDSTWYYEKCDGKCDKCRFANSDGSCKWEAKNED